MHKKTNFCIYVEQIVKKTFVVPGPSDSEGKSPSQVAGEITSFFTRKNFVITDRGETVTYVHLMECRVTFFTMLKRFF